MPELAKVARAGLNSETLYEFNSRPEFQHVNYKRPISGVSRLSPARATLTDSGFYHNNESNNLSHL